MIELTNNWPRSWQIADLLVKRIEAGEYLPGSQIPTILALMSEFRVSNKTVQKALKRLKDAGWIYSVPGMGVYVALELPKPPDQ